MFHATRDAVARRLMRLARRLSTDEGWGRESDRLGAPSMLAGLLRMRDRGVSLHAVVDGGACVGDWTQLLRKVFPGARVLMIEPQQRHAAALERLCREDPGHLQFACSLLGPPGQGEATFYVTDDTGAGTGSSVLPENSDVPRHAVSLPMTTLDALIDSRGFSAPDLIKLDVQGYELQVLAGADVALGRAEFVLLEVSFWPYNEGSPLVHDVVEWMHARGFRAYDVFDVSRRPDGVLLQVDLLFVRQGSTLVQDSRTIFATGAGESS